MEKKPEIKRTARQVLEDSLDFVEQGECNVMSCKGILINAMEEYANQETERLQAENQKMRKILSEIMNGMSAHLDYQDLMDEELTAEERATRANYDDFITQISTLLNQ